MPWKAPFSIPELFSGLVPSSTKAASAELLGDSFRTWQVRAVSVSTRNFGSITTSLEIKRN